VGYYALPYFIKRSDLMKKLLILLLLFVIVNVKQVEEVEAIEQPKEVVIPVEYRKAAWEAYLWNEFPDTRAWLIQKRR
jgi:hypothetical protein